MKNIILVDVNREAMLPVNYTKPIGALRIGILTIEEKWGKHFESAHVSFQTADYLSEKYQEKTAELSIYINAGVCPTPQLVKAIAALEIGEALYQGEELIAVYGNGWGHILQKSEFYGEFTWVKRPWDLFKNNGVEIELDFDLVTRGRDSQPISETNQVLGDRIFVEEGAKVECAILNATTGAIYIGKNAEVMEGAIVRGGLALLEGSVVKMGAKIYGPSTFGPYSKMGGEVSNTVVQGYSNKGHDGFLGNAVLGEWCNLGADTNSSNLKNNYAEVDIWSYADKKYEKTGLQFCGLIMGDHSKTGINTMLNTGTVVGVSANIFGANFPKKFVPSFTWGGADRSYIYKFDKAMEVAEKVMERRSKVLDETEKRILRHVFDLEEGARR